MSHFKIKLSKKARRELGGMEKYTKKEKKKKDKKEKKSKTIKKK